MEPDLPFLEVLGVRVLRARRAEALRVVESAAESGEPALVVYVNAHTLNLAAKDPSYRELLNGAAVVLNDGIGLAIAGKVLGGPFPENLNGSDLNPEILALAARKDWRVYFLGGEPGVATEAARRLSERIPGLRVAGARDGFFDRSQDQEVAELIRHARADVVMAAMGNPLQEVWLAENLEATGARLGVGVGAFFDFTAEHQKRAPLWMNRWGVEWTWRLAHDPKRMWRRYIVGNPAFLYRVGRQRSSKGSRTP